jgi:alcohol dehydrogenase
MKDFEVIVPERIVFGAGAINKLAEKAKGVGKKALVITGKSSRPEKAELTKKVVSLLKQAGIDSVVFDKVEQNPRATTCNEAAKVCRDNGCDVTVGIGGGSPMDVSKFTAMLAVNDGRMEDYMPGGKYAGKTADELKCLPIICIATTSGTGAEATPFAVVLNEENNNKPGMGYDFWYPRLSIVDPELTVSMPADVTRNTGVDVLYHALEAYISNTTTPFATILAAEAIRLTVANLKTAIEHPADIEARGAMAWASTLAGIAISTGGTIAIHGMGHPIGGHTDAAHGATLSAIAPTILDYTWKGNPKVYAGLAKLLGAAGDDEEKLAANCGQTLRAFLKTVGHDVTAGSLGVTKEMIPAMAEEAFFTMGGAMGNTWLKLTLEDVRKIYTLSL